MNNVDDDSGNDDRVDGDGGMVAGGRLPNADYPVVGPSLIIIPLPPAAVIIKAFLSSSGSSLLSACHRHKYTHTCTHTYSHIHIHIHMSRCMVI